MTLAPERPRRMRLPDSVSALGVRDFRVVWIGQAISMTGTWMQMIAQGLVVLALWESPFALGVVSFANAVPTLAVMLFGGVLADRMDRRRILLVTQVVMMLLAFAVGTLIAIGTAQFWMVVVATALLGTAFGYDMPAYQSFLPELVPPSRISQVVALNSATFHGSRMVGPAIAGGLIGAFGAAAAYFANGASFLVVIASLLIVRHRRAMPTHAERRSAISDLVAGLRHARQRPNLKALLAMNALTTTFLFPTLAILSPYYVTEVLHEGAAVLGIFWAVSGVGSVMGAIALVRWPTQARVARIVFGALAGPASMLVMATTRSTGVALVAFGMLSLSFAAQLGLVQAMVQESTPSSFRGRVMSLHGITFNGALPFAGLASSAIASAIGMRTVILGAGALALVSSLLVLRFAGGGIAKVVRDCRAEFEALAAAS